MPGSSPTVVVRSSSVRSRVANTAALLLLLLSLSHGEGCTDDDRLDGTWRQVTDSSCIDEGVSCELVLGQYGSDVAGLMRLYERRGSSSSRYNLYGAEQYCRPLQDGSIVDGWLGFQFTDPLGTRWSYSLQLSADEDRLVGNGSRDEDGQSQEGPRLEFTRISETIDKDCSWLNELVIHGFYDGERDDGRRLRVTVAYLGKDLGVPCLVEAGESVPLNGRTFALTIGRKPPSCQAIRSDEVSLAWGIFVLFEDLDGDDYWDRDPLPLGTMETLVGVGTDWVLVYLDGSLGREIDDEDHPLYGFSDQGFSLLKVEEKDDRGVVRRISRMVEGTIGGTVVTLSPADGSLAPRLTEP